MHPGEVLSPHLAYMRNEVLFIKAIVEISFNYEVITLYSYPYAGLVR